MPKESKIHVANVCVTQVRFGPGWRPIHLIKLKWRHVFRVQDTWHDMTSKWKSLQLCVVDIFLKLLILLLILQNCTGNPGKTYVIGKKSGISSLPHLLPVHFIQLFVVLLRSLPHAGDPGWGRIFYLFMNSNSFLNSGPTRNTRSSLVLVMPLNLLNTFPPARLGKLISRI